MKTIFHPIVIAWFSLLLAAVAGILIYNAVLFVKGWGLGSWVDRANQSILYIGMVFYADGIIDIMMKKRIGVWKMVFSTFLAFVGLVILQSIVKYPVLEGDGWKMVFRFYVGIPTAIALLSIAVLQIRKNKESAWSQLD